MGRYFSGLSSVVAPARLQATSLAHSNALFLSGADIGPWVTHLTAAGVVVTPDLALCLSAMYSGVTMIGSDLGTLPAQIFVLREDGGKDKVRPFHGRGIDSSNGIRSLAYMIRWQPNLIQTAVEFWQSMVVQYLLRSVAYAEMVQGPTGFLAQLLPRHPDRVKPERLPSGRLRYRLIEPNGQARFLTQDEMFVVRDLTFDAGLTPVSRVMYGAESIGAALATQRAASKFFKSGMTASTVLSYQGEADDEYEETLHKSITRYASGAENNAGFLMVPDKVDVKTLSIDPEKAQMMSSQEWGVREIARLLRMPASKLGVPDSVAYASAEQAALDYVIFCLRPIAVAIEQSIQRDLILVKDDFVSEFLLAALLRGDFKSQAEFIERLIRSRVMRPSEARTIVLNMNPDEALDRLSERDFQPGRSGAEAPAREAEAEPAAARRARGTRAQLTATLMAHDNALRCVRRERHRALQLATKHASDPDGWKAAIREFYADQASFIAQTMRLPIAVARDYAAQHGAAVEAQGVPIFDEHWEAYEADELCALALDGHQEAA